MKSPTIGSFKRLRRIVRYLSVTHDLEFPTEESDVVDGVYISLQVLSDVDQAGEIAVGRSQSSCFSEASAVPLSSVSRCRDAASSAEAAARAAAGALSEGILIKNILEFFGRQTTMELHVDDPAARAIIARDCVEESGHLLTEALWMQQAAPTGIVSNHRAGSDDNPVDLGVRSLSDLRLEKL